MSWMSTWRRELNDAIKEEQRRVLQYKGSKVLDVEEKKTLDGLTLFVLHMENGDKLTAIDGEYGVNVFVILNEQEYEELI